MKALILAGGSGTRLRPLTFTTTKQLLPVANRPILFYILDIVKKAGITSTGIIVSSDWGDLVKQKVGDGSTWEMTIDYITQSRPSGLAHAVKTARSFLSDSPFLMILGDNLYKIKIMDLMSKFNENSCDALLLLKEVQDPANFGIATMKDNNRITRVYEKPVEAPGNLALAGIYIFSSAIHQAIDDTEFSKRGELEITDAIQKLIDKGCRVHGEILDGWWLDTGGKDDLLAANRAALDIYSVPGLQGKVDHKTKLSGLIAIGKGSVVENCIIHGPVSIGDDCLLKDSRIGPYVSIGTGSNIEGTWIEDSVILNNVQIDGIEHINAGLFGNNSVISRNKKSGISSFLVSDYSRLEI